MVNFNFRLFRRQRQRQPGLDATEDIRSVLDIPFKSYDPSTKLPKAITVGEITGEPLVTLQSLRDHLTLLSAFHALQSSIPPTELVQRCYEYAEDYLHFAKRRCSRPPSRSVKTSTSSNGGGEGEGEGDGDGDGGGAERAGGAEGPKRARASLGVFMCWHAHMLNPKAFDDDREVGILGWIGNKSFPLQETAQKIRDGFVAIPGASDNDKDSSSNGHHGSETSTSASDHVIPKIQVNGTEPWSEEALKARKTRGTTWEAGDVAAAVLRQKKFIDNMAKIGWLREEYISKDKASLMDLQRGAVRYHAWLDLMHSLKGKEFMVPTLDIDLAWHTHQLSGKAYKADTERLLGFFLDHDDAAGEGKLGNGLGKTSELWKERYGYDYTF